MMPQMRTITQAAAWLRTQDPDTAITPTALRRMVTTGEIPYVRVGTKFLIDLQALAQYLQGDTQPTTQHMPDTTTTTHKVEIGGSPR